MSDSFEYIMKKARPRIVIIVKPSFGLLQDRDKYTIFQLYSRVIVM